jgi:hypothetical protein
MVGMANYEREREGVRFCDCCCAVPCWGKTKMWPGCTTSVG